MLDGTVFMGPGFRSTLHVNLGHAGTTKPCTTMESKL